MHRGSAGYDAQIAAPISLSLISSRHSLEEQTNLVETDVWVREEFSKGQLARLIDLPFLLEINERLLRNVNVDLDIPCTSGTLRKTRVVVRTRHGIDYPPHPERMSSLLECHLSWLGVLKARGVPTVLRAIHLAVALCAIHPFLEGNGRTARMASLALLLREGFHYRRGTSWEEYLVSERERWMTGIGSALKGSPGMLSTLFMEAVSALMVVPEADERPIQKVTQSL